MDGGGHDMREREGEGEVALAKGERGKLNI